MFTAAPPPRIRSRDVWVVLANTFGLVLGLVFLWHLRTVVTWILVSVFLALALRPVVHLLARHGVRLGLAVTIVGVSAIGLLALLIGTFVPLLLEQGTSLAESAPALMDRLERWDPVRWAVRKLGQDYAPAQILEQQASAFAGQALTVARTIAEGIVGAITIFALTMFMLLFGDELAERSLAWLPPARRDHARSLAQRMTKVVGGYVVGTLIVAAIGGVVMGTTVAALGVPYYLPLGLAMIFLGIIPYVGSAIASVLLIGVTFASQGWKEAAICAAVYVVYQQIENEVLHPLVQRRTIKMNALLIALVMLIGTAAAGVVGALLALPIAGAIQIVLGDALARRRARWGEHGSGEGDDAPADDDAPAAAPEADSPPPPKRAPAPA